MKKIQLISVIILTKNEEKNIKKCIMSVRFADEIILLDDFSSDKTLFIAKKIEFNNLRIFQRRLNTFSDQRNFALTQAKNEWVLFVDADEKISSELAEEIIFSTAHSKKNVQGYYVKRVDYLFGKELKFGETGDIKLLRLAKKNKGKWQGNVHEVWIVKGDVNTLIHPLYHYPHPTISEFLQDVNFYSSLRAKELFQQEVRCLFLHIFLYPCAKFVLNFIFKQGYKDGIPGFIFAVMMSFHSFLVRAKLYLLYR